MSVPSKKCRIARPQHMEPTPEPATSSAVTVDVVKSNMPTVSSSSRNDLSRKCSDEQVPAVDTNLDVVKAMIKDQEVAMTRATMEVLDFCESESEAVQVIRSIRELFKKEAENQSRTQTLAQTFVDLNAILTILKAMTQWKESLSFVSIATDVLKVLLFYIPASCQSMLQLDGTRILIEACEEHWFFPMVKAALAALSNVAPSLTRDAVVIEECLAFVEKVMKVFDADAQIQRLGTYFCLKLAASVAMSQGYQVQIGPPDAVTSSSSNCLVSKRKLDSC